MLLFRFVLFFCCLGISQQVLAQQLHFYHTVLQEEVIIRPGDIVKLEYRGYLQQPEALENRVIQIGGDAILLGQTVFGQVVQETQRTILLQDITGFRKFSRLRYTLKTATQIGTAVGSMILFRKVLDRSQLSGTGDILLTLGVGVASTVLVEVLFPKRVKKKINDGWNYQLR